MATSWANNIRGNKDGNRMKACDVRLNLPLYKSAGRRHYLNRSKIWRNYSKPINVGLTLFSLNFCWDFRKCRKYLPAPWCEDWIETFELRCLRQNYNALYSQYFETRFCSLHPIRTQICADSPSNKNPFWLYHNIILCYITILFKPPWNASFFS